jgi:ABC-type uncharacterized transport system substrate-binding protein
MKRVAVSAILAVVMLLGLAFIAEAQQQTKITKIGWLVGRRSSPNSGEYKKALRALGYIEGKNIAFEYRSAEGETGRYPALVDELVRLNVDLIVAANTSSALAAKNATRTIPIVFQSGGDPVAVGLIDSLARPGGNLTGFSNITSELTGKRLEFLKEIVPKLTRVAVLRDPLNAASLEEWKESLHPARELGLQLHSMEVSNTNKFESAFKDAVQARSAALLVTLSGVNNLNHKRIAALALKHRLPAISRFGEFVASGGLMSYGNDEAENFKRVAYLIDKILKGAKPADLPVERPTKFELVINLQTAKQIGLPIPPNVLARADKVIR